MTGVGRASQAVAGNARLGQERRGRIGCDCYRSSIQQVTRAAGSGRPT